MPDGITVNVRNLPPCDFDAKHGEAHYDGKTALGPWAFMCEECMGKFGIGLGTGLGQRLIVSEGETNESK